MKYWQKAIKKKTVNKYDSNFIWDKVYPRWRCQEENDCIKMQIFFIHLHGLLGGLFKLKIPFYRFTVVSSKFLNIFS